MRCVTVHGLVVMLPRGIERNDPGKRQWSLVNRGRERKD